MCLSQQPQGGAKIAASGAAVCIVFREIAEDGRKAVGRHMPRDPPFAPPPAGPVHHRVLRIFSRPRCIFARTATECLIALKPSGVTSNNRFGRLPRSADEAPSVECKSPLLSSRS